MICFKLHNFQTSFEKSFFLIVNKTILKYRVVSKILGRVNLFNLLNQNTLKFNLKRYFKLVYKTLKWKKIVFSVNVEKIVNNLSLKDSFLRKKKPNLLIFFKNKEISLLNECRKYNISVLNF
jgi:hypothetical protein